MAAKCIYSWLKALIRVTMATKLVPGNHHSANQKTVHCIESHTGPLRSLAAGGFLAADLKKIGVKLPSHWSGDHHCPASRIFTGPTAPRFRCHGLRWHGLACLWLYYHYLDSV
jgi:hypothetical protein